MTRSTISSNGLSTASFKTLPGLKGCGWCRTNLDPAEVRRARRARRPWKSDRKGASRAARCGKENPSCESRRVSFKKH